MALTLAGHLFTGPVPVDTAEIRRNQDPAVWAIVAKSGAPWDPAFHLLDLGETGEHGMKFADHPRRPRWDAVAPGPYGVYLLAVPRASDRDASERKRIIEEIRSLLDPTNGPVLVRPGQR